MQIFLGSQYVNDFEFNNRAYRVYVQADQRYRSNAAGTEAALRAGAIGRHDSARAGRRPEGDDGAAGHQPLQSVPRGLIERIGGAGREFRRRAEGDGARRGRAPLPPGNELRVVGDFARGNEGGQQSLYIFGLALILVYLTLAAQYESLVLPFIVLLGVPLAVLGALGAQWARGLSNDVYCQVGLVMLIGLAAKNAILIVEFAEQLRAKGLTVVDAAIEAARIRLRPILMTSLAFILGVLPLVFATGAGEAARHSVGTAVAGGMFVSTFLNLVFIPVLYVVVQTVRGVGRKTAKPTRSIQAGRRFENHAGHAGRSEVTDETGGSIRAMALGAAVASGLIRPASPMAQNPATFTFDTIPAERNSVVFPAGDRFLRLRQA